MPPGAMRPVLLSILMASVLLSAVGSGGPAEASSSATEVIDLLPARTDRRQEEDGFGRNLNHNIHLKPPDENLIQALRWSSPSPSQHACLDKTEELIDVTKRSPLIRPATSREELLSVFLDLAQIQLQKGKDPEATEAVSNAKLMVACATSRLQPRQISRIYWYEAVARANTNEDDAIEAFVEAMGIDPSGDPVSEYLARRQHILRRAQTAFRQKATLEVDLDELPGVVFVDGSRIAYGARVHPGEHVIQVENAQQIRAAIVNIPNRSPVRLGPLLASDLPTSTRVGEALASRLARGELLEYQETVLRQYMKDRQAELLVFAVQSPTLGKSLLRGYHFRGGWIRGEYLEISKNKNETPHFAIRQAARGVAFGMASQTLRGEPAHFEKNAQGIGLYLAASLPFRNWSLEGRFMLFPRLSAMADSDCTDVEQSSIHRPASAAIAMEEGSATSCPSTEPHFELGIGPGLLWRPISRLRLKPGLLLTFAYLPDLLLESDRSSKGWPLLTTASPLGISSRLEARLELIRQRPSLELVAEIHGGASTAKDAVRWHIFLPFGASLAVGSSF